MKDTLWTKEFILLIMANSLAVCSFQLLFPTLPVFLSEHGNNSQEVGIVMGIFTLSAVLVRPFTAVGSRRWGKKVFLNVGQLISLLAICTYILGVTFFSALSIRIIHGIGFGISTTLFAVILADLTPSVRRGESIGYLGFGIAVTSSLAPFLGLWVFNGFGPIYLFSVTALALLLSMLCVVFISKPVPVDPPDSNSSRNVFGSLIEKTAVFPAFLAFLLGLCFGSVMSFMALFGKEIDISNVGWFFFANIIGSFSARLIAGRVFDRKGPAFTIIPGAIMGTMGLVLLSQTTSTYQLILSAVLYGLGSGSILPSLQAWIMNMVASNRRTEATAMFYNSFDIGIGGGAVILGFLASVSSYSFMYFCTAVIMFSLLVIYVCSKLRKKRSNHSIEMKSY
ncbi:MFS transporter [Neobacillus sp. 3P2-tot-E-2]|uniref:MFS transporter n=1 Tax=Neobacillus sp. 3P2-tot-E-2 TaxID=3132212 RepID=UPI00399FD169